MYMLIMSSFNKGDVPIINSIDIDSIDCKLYINMKRFYRGSIQKEVCNMRTKYRSITLVAILLQSL